MADKRITILLGARRVGKTTIIKNVLDNQPILWLNADEIDVREALTDKTSSSLKAYFGNYKTIVIDEALRIKNIGLTLKLIYDNFNDVKVFATGSSAFEMANEIKEPLTGRKWEFNL